MRDHLAIARAVRDIASAVIKEDHPDPAGIMRAAVGINQAIPTTPFCEVIPSAYSLEPGLGKSLHEEPLTLECVFYVALTPNLEADEDILLPLVKKFNETFYAPNPTDTTLGGLVDDVVSLGGSYDIINRNNRTYRVGAVRLETL